MRYYIYNLIFHWHVPYCYYYYYYYFPSILPLMPPLVSTLILLFISLSLCLQHLFHFHTVLITSWWASQGVISSCWPTSCSGRDHFLMTHWNHTYYHFLKFVPTSHFFNSVNASVSHIKIIFLLFSPSFLTPTSLFLKSFIFSFLLRYTKHLYSY